MPWVLILLAVIVFATIGMYNSLVRLRVRVNGAWADIDVQLKRRWELIPNLLETVKGSAGHERETLQAVIDARNRAMSAQGPSETAAAEGVLAGALGKLFALSEAYPELRAVEAFTGLQGSLDEVEGAVQNARRYYNAVVRDYNTKTRVFPTNLLAGVTGHRPQEFFTLDDERQREGPRVSFS
ncbi:LemA family protein [Candidatus Palauibacter sp.]|uniref:LemA family protein n=1 Tax=Candidatus Palauibacter sp. TaxID=3101350 RepID=UPI003B0122E8